jgi:hypothetical protein
MQEATTLGQALAEFRRANGIPCNEVRSWTCRLGPLTLRLPNFPWRRRAILRHDLHHVLTGYPCTLRGEFQMAAWEFAAGCFPHPAATLFCLPLVAAGMLWSPSAMWSAFTAGRCTRSLYADTDTDALLATPLASVPAAARSDLSTADACAFALLVAQAFLLAGAPVLLFAAWRLLG